jgi:Leucine-rich repeat (LRR) protein
MKIFQLLNSKVASMTMLMLSTLCINGQVLNDTTYIYRSLSSAMENPSKVFRLNLSKKQYKEFPHEIFQFKNLRELDLSKNKIQTLPPEIGNLTNLQKLNMANNKLDSLPQEIGNLINLIHMNLSRNKIVELPVTIGNLENLEVLELWDNELNTIPEELSDLKKLKLLELRGILFSDEEGARIDSLLPNTKVMMSPTCNCKYN